jgi:pyruvate/2-oxoglutarate dehydrogenase complex dihydrolipoamide acyltransferase (E2) component
MSETISVYLPDLGDSVDEALLVEWSVAVGDLITSGQTVAIIETDKVTLDLPAERDGRVTSLQVAAGSILEPGALLYQLAA